MRALPAALRGPAHRDRLWMTVLGGAVLLIIVLVSIFAPMHADNDPRPTIDNTGPGGAKAAFLTLEALHYPVARWNQPLDELNGVDAAHTTLVLAAPMYSALEKDRLAAALKQFMERGGHVLITGGGGALLLPHGSVRGIFRLQGLCYTTPEGPGSLARAGSVEMQDEGAWDGNPAVSFVAQRCGPDPVVVRLPVGRGEAAWWSSASPLTNAELHRDADLQLLLVSVGRDRQVLFDESLLSPVRSPWSATRGLPLWWMLGQGALLFLLLVFSFSRRRDPIRMPVAVPRSSPVEFAVSMGDLYARAGATGAATEAARRRLLRLLVREGGLATATVAAGPEAIAQALALRYGGSWSSLRDHLREAADAAETSLKPGSALRLVRTLHAEGQRVRRAAERPAAGVPLQDSDGVNIAT